MGLFSLSYTLLLPQCEKLDLEYEWAMKALIQFRFSFDFFNEKIRLLF